MNQRMGIIQMNAYAMMYYMVQDPLYTLLVFLGFGGFLLAFFIWHKKTAGEVLVCPIRGTHCNSVVHSDYSKVFGIPVEKLGMLFYSVIAIGYGFILFLPGYYLPLIASTFLFLSMLAFFFSVYLTILQAFVIKNWCTWCLISTIICLMIFTISALKSPLFSALFSNFLHGL
jgi:uncharacterized membrane protein